jgi:hypothetical protein
MWLILNRKANSVPNGDSVFWMRELILFSLPQPYLLARHLILTAITGRLLSLLAYISLRVKLFPGLFWYRKGTSWGALQPIRLRGSKYELSERFVNCRRGRDVNYVCPAVNAFHQAGEYLAGAYFVKRLNAVGHQSLDAFLPVYRLDKLLCQ